MALSASPRWLLYGANGYTGELIAREAVRRGMRPVLAGRSREDIAALADALACPAAVFALEAQARLLSALSGLRAVLNCAGPFSATAAPMMQACLASHVHYLDITGEIEVFELARSLDEKAHRAGVVLCPGVGFDVVPTDCLAAALQDALPEATQLALGFDSRLAMSHGTAATMIEGLAGGGKVRRNGRIERVSLAGHRRRVDFGDGEKDAVTVAWGDVSTAYYTTGIPNIEVYVPMRPGQARWLRLLDLLRPALRLRAVQRRLQRRIDKGLRGPDAQLRARTPVYVWGEVRDPAGHVRVGRVKMANAYTVTVHSALAVLAELLSRPKRPGYATPAMLMGAGFVNSLPGSSGIRISER